MVQKLSSLIVWGCISAFRVGNLHIWKGPINAEQYRIQTISFSWKHGRPFIFQQHNAEPNRPFSRLSMSDIYVFMNIILCVTPSPPHVHTYIYISIYIYTYTYMYMVWILCMIQQRMLINYKQPSKHVLVFLEINLTLWDENQSFITALHRYR